METEQSEHTLEQILVINFEVLSGLLNEDILSTDNPSPTIIAAAHMLKQTREYLLTALYQIEDNTGEIIVTMPGPELREFYAMDSKESLRVTLESMEGATATQ